MSFSDMIKKSVLEKFQTADLTTTNICVTLGLAALIGLFIYLIYRINSRSGFYNRGFNKALMILPVVTAAIMLAMGSSLTLSLGMVGALSIVRFRNAVKDSMDLTFLFWSISVGIIVGAGIVELALILSVVVALLVMFIDLFPRFRTPSLLVVSGTDVSAEKMLIARTKEYARFVKVSSRNVTQNGEVEWILEAEIKGDEANLMDAVTRIETVHSVHLMTHNGEIRF